MKLLFKHFLFLIIFLIFETSFAKQSSSFNLDLSTLSFAQGSRENLNFQAQTYGAFSTSGKRLSAGASAGIFFASYPDINFQIPEAYVSYKLNDKSTFSFGRKFLEESLFLDSDWGLSVLQSSFRSEPLKPELQGLTGVHYNYKASKFFIYGLFSPVFIPDQNVSLDSSGEGVTSDNPWAVLPPEEVDLNGSRTALDYQIENDSLPDLLTQLQFGGAMGFDFDNVRVSAFYYYRPSRQLSYAISAKGSNESEDEVVVKANVTPQFLKEHLYGLQAKLDWLPSFYSKHGAYGTVVKDSQLLKQSQIYQTQIDDYFIFTNSLGFRFKNKGSLVASHVHFNRRSVEDVSDNNVYIDFDKYIHGSAVKIKGDYKASRKLVFNAGALFDYDNKGIVLDSGLRYRFKKNLSFWSKLQILQDLDTEEVSGSIFERFEGLDSFRVGASFAF